MNFKNKTSLLLVILLSLQSVQVSAGKEEREEALFFAIIVAGSLLVGHAIHKLFFGDMVIYYDGGNRISGSRETETQRKEYDIDALRELVIKIKNFSGSICIEGTDKNKLVVESTKYFQSGGKDKVIVHDPAFNGNNVFIKAENLNLNILNEKVDFKLQVPKNSTMVIETSYGPIKINDVKQIEARTNSGNIEVDHAGDVDVSTVYGRINLKNVNGVKAKTSSGNIEVNHAGDVDVSTVYGRIDLKNVNGVKAKTSSGNIEVDHADGVDASTVHGSIQATNIKNSLFAKTGSGFINALLTGSIIKAHAETTHGNIKLTLPQSYTGFVQVETTHGKIVTDFPQFKNNIVNAVTGHGSIEIKKAN